LDSQLRLLFLWVESKMNHSEKHIKNITIGQIRRRESKSLSLTPLPQRTYEVVGLWYQGLASLAIGQTEVAVDHFKQVLIFNNPEYSKKANGVIKKTHRQRYQRVR